MHKTQLQCLFNTFPNFKSPFADDRRREWESLEILKEFKSCWQVALRIDDADFITKQEEIISEFLHVLYEAKNIVFNRLGKQIKFEFQFEEIIF